MRYCFAETWPIILHRIHVESTKEHVAQEMLAPGDSTLRRRCSNKKRHASSSMVDFVTSNDDMDDMMEPKKHPDPFEGYTDADFTWV